MTWRFSISRIVDSIIGAAPGQPVPMAAIAPAVGAVTAWCTQNLTHGSYSVTCQRGHSYIYCELESDALLFSLRWSQAAHPLL